MYSGVETAVMSGNDTLRTPLLWVPPMPGSATYVLREAQKEIERLRQEIERLRSEPDEGVDALDQSDLDRAANNQVVDQVPENPSGLEGARRFSHLDQILKVRPRDERAMTKDEKAIKKRLEEMRSELLNWDQNDPHGTRAGTVYSSSSYRSHTKDELRGWIAALEWVGGAGGL